MQTKIIKYITLASIGALFLVGFAGSAFAATTSTSQMSRIITRSDNAISMRLTALNDLIARLGMMQNVSDTEKLTLTSGLQTQITNLTTLKAKIDADTDM